MPQYRKSSEQQIVESILRGIGWVLKLPFRGLFNKKSSPSIDRGEVQNRWQTIEQLARSSDQHNLSQAIILADKLLDAILIAKGVGGETMGERLKLAREIFSDYSIYQGAWDGHKLRNQIAHELDHQINLAEAQAAIEKLKQAVFSLI